MRGQIIKIISDTHIVISDQKTYTCKCRGIFRHKHIVPLVGDMVEFNQETLRIEEILPRHNEFIRPAVSNIDQGFLVTSLKNPDFSLSLLDKLLVLMELHKTKSIICITKEDLLTQEEKNKLKPFLDYYKNIGYKVVSNKDIDRIKKYLEQKTSVFTGQTGAGKSTLLNNLNPDWKLQTGEISKALGRGKHTTRVVELFTMGTGKVLDTPGFSALEFKDYKEDEIKDAFIEFKNYSCPFKDCSHTNEKECIIKKKVEEGKILRSRYESYLKLRERRF